MNHKAWRIVRTGSTPPDALDFAQRSATFGAAARNFKVSTLLVHNGTETGLQQFVISTDKPGSERVAGNAASAVGGRAEPVDDIPDLDLDCIARLVAKPSAHGARETQAGAKPDQVAEFLARGLPVGCWVAISMRKPTNREVNRTRLWYNHRLGGNATHHTRAGEVLIVNVRAGGPDRQSVVGVLSQIAGALPGFDIEVETSVIPGKGLPAGVSLATAFGLYLLATHGHKMTDFVPQFDTTVALGLALVPALVALAYFLNLVPTALSKMQQTISDGWFPAPLHRHAPARPPRHERTDNEGRVKQAFSGDYPLSRFAFLVGPSVVLGLVSPHTGSTSGAAVTQMRDLPVALRENHGPYLGANGGEVAHISQADRYAGLCSIGIPGSGKSVLVQNVFAYDSGCRTRAARLGELWSPVVPGDVGSNNTLVAFESKGGDGLTKYIEWLRTTGDKGVVVEVADPNTPAIDMFDFPGTVAERAASFVDSMVYAFGESSIAYQSANTLKIVFTAAMHITKEDLTNAELEPLSVVEIASVLLSGRGDDVGRKLASVFENRVSHLHPDDPSRPELVESTQRLSILYGAGVTPAQRRTLTTAPTSKVEALLSSRSWWSSKRGRTTWRDIIRNHWAVVVNTGPARSGAMIDEALGTHLTAMLMYGLQRSIIANCAGWGERGDRAVTIFSDELAMLCGGGNSDVFTWLRDQGRSFGVRPVMATQRPEQLPSAVRQAVLSFGTFVWYSQTDPTTIRSAVEDLAADGSDWAPSDVAGLEPHHAVLRATVNKQRQPAVPIKVSFWGGREDEFMADQGLI